MDFLCKVCDKSIIENQSKYNNYIATKTKEQGKSFYKNYTIINPNLDEIDKILKDYISKHIKKFDIKLIICKFDIVFDINFKIHKKSAIVIILMISQYKKLFNILD